MTGQETGSGSGPTWRNWSGFLEAHPARFETPASEQELVRLVSQDPEEPVRVVGSGHSFSPLCPSAGLMLDLSELSGIASIDREQMRATILAGTKIWQLGEPLLAQGLAMTNMGDIDRQAIAGAVSTGTHGTGTRLGSISSQVTALRLVDARGEIVGIRSRAEADTSEIDIEAARVSLGVLGIVTQIELQLVPAFKLHERMWHATLEECLAQVDELASAHRHFEFFYSPAHRKCAMKSLDPVAVETPDSVSDDYDADRMRGERIGYSCRIFPSPRERLFNEIEFSIPQSAGVDCLQELVALLHGDFPDVQWPLEYRFVRGEDAWLSPSFGRDSVTISAHEGADRPHQEFFAAVEEIFIRHAGRPHWGKIHTQRYSRLSSLYPRFEEFRNLRQRLDPTDRFLNRHLATIFESIDRPAEQAR